MNEVSEQWARRKEEIKALSEHNRCHLILIIDDSISDYAC